MFNYLFITNKPEVASYVESHGVNRIFVDLEILGKEERQGHLNTVISRHSMEDVRKVKESLKTAELMVRVNPLNRWSKKEIDQAISNGADIIMQPMFRSVEEVSTLGSMIDGRAKFIPLVETKEAALQINEIASLSCVNEIHIGLNDLHIDLNLKFMFEIIANGMADSMVSNLSKPFGIGGIARVGEGKVPGELVMAEHVRLGSSAVILSRAFHSGASSLDELNNDFDFSSELKALEECRQYFLSQSDDSLKKTHKKFVESVLPFLRAA